MVLVIENHESRSLKSLKGDFTFVTRINNPIAAKSNLNIILFFGREFCAKTQHKKFKSALSLVTT